MKRWRKFFWVQTCIKPNLVLSEISEMKRWRVRWRDEKKFFWVRTCIKPNLVSKIFPFIGPNLVLSEISEMKSEMKKWTDEENFFGSEHVSSQIWCYLKLVRWRDEEWDEEMKIFFWSEHVSSQIWCYLKLVRWRDEQMKKMFFWVWTCIKPNLVLSEISKMKSEMKKWTDEENFFWSEHVSSQIWCYLKLVRWRDEEWDEEMKRWKKKFWGPNMYQAKSGVENFSLYWGVRKSYIQADKHTNRHTYGHHSDQISRSARERRSD